MNPLTTGIEERFRSFVKKLGMLSDDEAVGAMLECFALGMAAGGAFQKKEHMLEVLETTHARAMELTEDTRYFADKRLGPGSKKKRRRRK